MTSIVGNTAQSIHGSQVTSLSNANGPGYNPVVNRRGNTLPKYDDPVLNQVTSLASQWAELQGMIHNMLKKHMNSPGQQKQGTGPSKIFLENILNATSNLGILDNVLMGLLRGLPGDHRLTKSLPESSDLASALPEAQKRLDQLAQAFRDETSSRPETFWIKSQQLSEGLRHNPDAHLLHKNIGLMMAHIETATKSGQIDSVYGNQLLSTLGR